VTDKSAIASYSVNGSTALIGFVTVELLAITIGIIMCLATYATTYYFQKLRNKREKELHILQVDALKRGSINDKD
jgi:hypothetical protein